MLSQLVIHNVLTLCMLAILFRWAAPTLEVNIYSGRWAILPRCIDPATAFIRKQLPPMGAMDLSPFVLLGIFWVVRVILTRS